ncbi:hypothetical protein BC831DRAFT_508233 [Entophlyctis helioformis]|nr:hypothetical protein BC831DRAFT_508233 [Entophlyctis helioformis]
MCWYKVLLIHSDRLACWSVYLMSSRMSATQAQALSGRPAFPRCLPPCTSQTSHIGAQSMARLPRPRNAVNRCGSSWTVADTKQVRCIQEPTPARCQSAQRCASSSFACGCTWSDQTQPPEDGCRLCASSGSGKSIVWISVHADSPPRQPPRLDPDGCTWRVWYGTAISVTSASTPRSMPHCPPSQDPRPIRLSWVLLALSRDAWASSAFKHRPCSASPRCRASLCFGSAAMPGVVGPSCALPPILLACFKVPLPATFPSDPYRSG